MKGLENHSAVRARGNSLTREEKAKVKADFIAGKITVITPPTEPLFTSQDSPYIRQRIHSEKE
jgi:DUF4097 and DUF4098 domain-containing protein YvlB